ncbi:ABC1 kinase family protein [Ornithinimicrobium panacihumi]|uniref:ABC1 kinase family protein n=1 Tax=Ornithinimicrobium panacihumi TaxID=2008449 RepID=UPI003F8B008F
MGLRRERTREIVETLSRHGLGFLVGEGVAGKGRPERLVLALEALGPTFVKLGQVLSTRSDLLPPAYTSELARLQDSAAPVPTADILAAIEEELGSADVFDRFDAEPLASASIGQAHTARLDGTEVVVKVRRPGAVETVRTDLEILERLAHLAAAHSELARGYDLVGIVQEFATTLRAELDYLKEARNAERFATSLADDPRVHVPRVFWETTTSRVLTLERVEGLKIDDLAALGAAGIDRRDLAARATGVLCTMVFEDGFFHADPHPGNFFVGAGGELAVIDFGMVGELGDEVRDQLVALFINLLRGDLDRTVRALLELVGQPEDVDRRALADDLRPLVRRFGGLSLADLALTELITEVLGLARRHRLRLPQDLALLFKMLLMAEGLGRRLDPGFELGAVLAPYAERLARERHSPEAVAERLTQSVRGLVEAGAQTPETMRNLARVLERGGFDVHLRSSELDHLLREADRVGNRMIAGVIAAALINGLGGIIASDSGRWRRLKGPLVVGGGAALGALGSYLSTGTVRRRPRR